MKILAHRGYWKREDEKNTMTAFRRAFEKGYGIETDVRDYMGQLVISHNIANEESPLFEDVLALYKETKCNGYLAINIKADGLQDDLQMLLQKYNMVNYFVFDMSVPELVVYRARKMNYFTRLSEYETEPVLVPEADGIWMDEWESAWITGETVADYIEKGKKVSIISPEIHNRNPETIWNIVKTIDSEKLMLCVDAVDEFLEFLEK